MLVYAGIDEAGYGPMLGPLCIGASVFVIDDVDPESGAPDLWKMLNRAVCRSRRDSRQRIAVDDSKKLKGQSKSKTHPLKHLERGVLSFCNASAFKPADDASLFEHLGTTCPAMPWYDSTTTLPVGQDADQIDIDGSRVRRAFDSAGIRSFSLACELIDVERFNSLVDRLGNKASVNLGAILRLIDNIWTTHARHDPRIIVDRQSGRMRYREELHQAWPDASIRIVAESEAISRYRLERGDSTLTVSFIKEAEDHHLPVALASMTAKYVRELTMIRLNRYFQHHLPDLRPTAGYVSDARRYLQEIAEVVTGMNVPRSQLVRDV